MSEQNTTRRRILQGAMAAGALGAFPYIRMARAQGTPIKIGIPTVVTGG